MLMKTCAAFANNRGGIVFGIEDGTRRLVGLSSRKLRDFDNYDIAKATAKFNALFSPSISSKATHNTDNMQFGVIYVYQCETRPVIAQMVQRLWSKKRAHKIRAPFLRR